MIEFSMDKVYMDLDTAKLLAKFNLQSGGRVQKVIDAAVIRYNMPYVPMDVGTLAKSPYANSVIGSGEIIYGGPGIPYARYLYYGEVYGPSIPVFEDDSDTPSRWFSPPGQKKIPTGRPINYRTDVNPMAGSYWFERMKADHLDDIVEEAKKSVGRK